MNNQTTPMDDQIEIPSADQQAHQWMVLLTSDEADDRDRSRFERWLAIDTDHQRAWQETQLLWQQSSQLKSLGRLHQPKSPSHQDKVTPLRPARRWTQIGTGLALAASLLLAVGLWLPTSPNNESGVNYRSELASSRQIHLPEGSVITLGANSEIELYLTEQQRQVNLVRGEAFFDVAKDSRRPFLVNTDTTQVKVLGTRFNVNQLQERAKVSVESGLVAVTHKQSQKQVELTPGERVISSTEGLGEISLQDAAKSGAWREGLRLYFDAPLTDVIEDFNRYSQRPLQLQDPALGQLSLTAVFPTDNIDAMVNSLSDVLPLVITEEDDRIVLSHR